MIERGVAAGIYRVARGTADDRGGGPLESVTAVIGELADVEPGLLEAAWRAIVEGTADEQARLFVDWRAARQTCSQCGEIRERVPGFWLRFCPCCEAPLAISGGDELDVRSVAFSSGPSVAAGGG